MKRWGNSKIDKIALDPQVSYILVGKTNLYIISHKGAILLIRCRNTFTYSLQMTLDLWELPGP